MRFRLATWNINSVRLRLELIARLVREAAPDVLCLQEIKCIDGSFPLDPLRALGFEHILIAGQKGYHGVATLSRLPMTVLERCDFHGRGEARHLSVTLGSGDPAEPLVLHNVYVPAGGDIPDPELNPKFRHKLDYLAAMARRFAAMQGRARNRMILVGDLNVAPLATDVWSHRQLLRVVSHTPVELAHLAALQASHDWVDVMREHVRPEESLFTWWSYRARDWRASNRGRRLDHVWVTPALRDASTSMQVMKDARDWSPASDHVPVVVDFDLRGRRPRAARRAPASARRS